MTETKNTDPDRIDQTHLPHGLRQSAMLSRKTEKTGHDYINRTPAPRVDWVNVLGYVVAALVVAVAVAAVWAITI